MRTNTHLELIEASQRSPHSVAAVATCMQRRALYFPLRTEMLLVDTCPLLRVSQPAAAPCWAPAALAGSGELGVAGYDVEVRGDGRVVRSRVAVQGVHHARDGVGGHRFAGRERQP